MIQIDLHLLASMPGETLDLVSRQFEKNRSIGAVILRSFAAGIMNRHGGRLVLESSDHQGTTFAVWIPAADEK
jgi:signal transduction histidine kinase